MVFQALSLFAVLRALALTVAFLMLAPKPEGQFAAIPPALADDDDGDNDDDDDDDGPAQRRAPPLRDHFPNEVLLINPSPAALERTRSLGFSDYATEVIGDEGLTVVHLRLPAGLDARAALALLRREAPDAVSDLNHLYRLLAAPGPLANPLNCSVTRCYGHRLIGWSKTLAACGKGLKIGILDTGVDVNHPSLRAGAVTSVSFVAPPARASSTQHGTAILSLLAGNDTEGFAGLLPQAQFFAADVFHIGEDGNIAADAVAIARGLAWLAGRGVSVVNASLAGPENRLIERVVSAALARKIVVVAAAGNDGPNARPRYPAALPGVVAVTAVDARRRVYRRAASGPHIDYAAPGVNVWTAQPRGRYGPSTGTSYATPFATAVFALTGAQREPETEDLGGAGRDPVFGNGLIRAPSQCQTALSGN